MNYVDIDYTDIDSIKITLSFKKEIHLISDSTIKDPKPGSIWRHHSGRIYTVLCLTNADGDREKYPRTIVYVDHADAKLWSGRLDDWHRRMTEMVL